MESTTSSFTNLLQNDGNHEYNGSIHTFPFSFLLSNKSAKIEVGLLGGLYVKIESEGHHVQLNNSLIGGLRLNVNQKDPNLHEDLHKLKVESDSCKIDKLEKNIYTRI